MFYINLSNEPNPKDYDFAQKSPNMTNLQFTQVCVEGHSLICDEALTQKKLHVTKENGNVWFQLANVFLCLFL